MKYRRDIDGLRTIAVGVVILFHFNVPYITGGYVGVDVFFVISGFLISKILLDEIDGGTYSILRFYERRARRILPALFLVLLATTIWAALVMWPADFQRYGQSGVATLLFLANVFFWKNSGYFQGEAEREPLLHMWSLAVEEQFYIVFPIFLFLVYGKLGRKAFVASFYALFIGSLALSIVATKQMPTFSFYMPVTRAWELMLGTLLARQDILLPVLARFQRPVIREIAGALGLGLIAWASFALTSDSTFPGEGALAPVIGAGLLIWSGAPNQDCAPGHIPWTARLLSVGPMVATGLISYSLYLWHWPVKVLSELTFGGWQHAWWGIALLILICGALAWLSWRFVEAPFRKPKLFSQMQIFKQSGVGAMVALGIFGAVMLAPGALTRIDLSSDQLSMLRYEDYREQVTFPKADCFLGRKSSPEKRCPDLIGGTVLWGDSYAEHLSPGLISVGQGAFAQVTNGGCPPFLYLDGDGRTTCQAYSRKAMNWIRDLAPERVIISARWNLYNTGRWNLDFEAELSQSLAFLEELGVAEVIVLGMLPAWEKPVPQLIVEHQLNGAAVTTLPLTQSVYTPEDDARIAALIEQTGASFVPLADTRCPAGMCPLYLEDETLYQWDKGHLTIGGSEIFVAALDATYDLNIKEAKQ